MENQQQESVRQYYDEEYYRQIPAARSPSSHNTRLSRRLAIGGDIDLLDVGCGAGTWLKAASEAGARVSGLDLSNKALAAARNLLPGADLTQGSAEELPWPAKRFDVVTCLGSLEHVIQPERALREMWRVVKPSGFVVLLVPNSGFLTRRLGLYKGTEQAKIIEVVHSIEEWESMFRNCGLEPIERWKDLHVLSRSWITRGAPWMWPLRASQALTLAIWPLRWQYQVYFRCIPMASYGGG